MIIFIAHFILAISLFLITNWIGKHSTLLGYVPLSIDAKTSEAPAFNLIYRAFSPIAFIVISSAIFYFLSLDSFAKNIYLVVVYYFIFRIAFNVMIERTTLVNWFEFAFIALLSITASYLIYDQIIAEKTFLFPSKEELGAATWIAVVAFLYKTVNSIEPSNKAASKRKNKYIREQYDKYERIYGGLISDIAKTATHQNLVLSVMIYEGFNRPKLYRTIENLVFPKFKKKATIGPMQVSTETPLTDEQSIRLGAAKLIKEYENELKNSKDLDEVCGLGAVRRAAFLAYNNSSSYAWEVEEIYETLEAYDKKA